MTARWGPAVLQKTPFWSGGDGGGSTYTSNTASWFWSRRVGPPEMVSASTPPTKAQSYRSPDAFPKPLLEGPGHLQAWRALTVQRLCLGQIQRPEVMDLGPTATRADTMLESILERLNARKVDSILVATSDGRLVGTLYRSDADRRLYKG